MKHLKLFIKLTKFDAYISYIFEKLICCFVLKMHKIISKKYFGKGVEKKIQIVLNNITFFSE